MITRASLFDPKFERAACGVGFIVNINGKPSRKLLDNASTISERMTHRGACSCDNLTGDGAGIMIATPDSFYRGQLGSGVELPPAGSYATGLMFLDSKSAESREQVKRELTELAESLGLRVLAWRRPPTDNSCLGQVAISTEPHIEQVFVSSSSSSQQDLSSQQSHRYSNNDNYATKPGGDNTRNHQKTTRTQSSNNINDINSEFERKVFMLRKRSSHRMVQKGLRFYFCSLSTRTIVYKGQFTPAQLWQYYGDLQSASLETHLAIVHARFSTNTYPNWERAHPMRLLAHNGEINTLRGNVNLMHAREGIMKSSKFGDQLNQLYPVIEPDMSDSGTFDNVLEFLVQAGDKSLPEAMLCMVPEAWQNDTQMAPKRRAFYQWASCTMEPWDGPALFTFSDGRYVGAILDRNGLRPSRYYELSDGHLVMASEVGVLDAPASQVLRKGRLRPGRMLLIDTQSGALLDDEGARNFMLDGRPFEHWCRLLFTLEDVQAMAHEFPVAQPAHNANNVTCDGNNNPVGPSSPQLSLFEDKRLTLFGYSMETINMLLVPMVRNHKEALGSMGNDAPLACLSMQQPLVYEYFKQLFAQITNPPIDPFREQCIMSLSCPIGPEYNILEASESHCDRLWLEQPILSCGQLELLKATRFRGWRTKVVDCTFPAPKTSTSTNLHDDNNHSQNQNQNSHNQNTQDRNANDTPSEMLISAIDRICQECLDAANLGYSLIVLSDRQAGAQRLPVSSLLALGAVHHHLIESRSRMRVGLVVETGEAREVHHMCVLLGYGADAICPYLVFETLEALSSEARLELSSDEIFNNYVDAMKTGISKVMAKMGISTLQSYKGAQIFEAVGLSGQVVDKCFRNTVSRIGGATFEVLAHESLLRHRQTYMDNKTSDNLVLVDKGFYHWRSGGEKHINDPEAIANLQDAAKRDSPAAFRSFTDATRRMLRKCTLRGQLELKYAPEAERVPIDEVEPATDIVKRFCTGAMSFGSISIEAHETMAVAMNRIGGRSNTGEGGEDERRWLSQSDGSKVNKRSAIKQIASGRFGVTAAYVANSDELQIKIAQGAKPGEGGELPGHKVTEDIAKTRHSIAGVGLISPPPHHDIYSIEDIAELMYDLKSANPAARISVKLVSEIGVGIVAAGVAKGKAEHIVISGHDGGTGASSWTGIKNAGLPWELGLSETHQVLVANDLRSRVILQVDGQLRTAFDVLCGALLGADEFGFSTAPLITLGCIMMRKCHLNTCPVGIATQDPVLRKKFEGQPEHLINYLFLLAEDIRAELSKMGFRRLNDVIGRTELLEFLPDPENYKVKHLDLSSVLCDARTLRPGVESVIGGRVRQDFELDKRLDYKLIAQSQQLMDNLESTTKPLILNYNICNRDRAFASTLSCVIAKRFGERGLGNTEKLRIMLRGTGGQSLCAFLPLGVTVCLEGDSNDYVAKGLSGGKVVVYPPKDAPNEFESNQNIIVGNVCLYGATSGKLLVSGIAAERFCVRNSGATAVVEGVGDHACEYMTGGLVLVLGPTGRNFAAGMSGGLAFVLDPHRHLRDRRKCQEPGVDLLALDEQEDIDTVHELLKEFALDTGSLKALELLSDWPKAAELFTKVYPREYRRALDDLKKRNEQALLKQQLQQQAINCHQQQFLPTRQPLADVNDIEDVRSNGLQTVSSKKESQPVDENKLDKVHGFVKYKRIKGYYRPANKRLDDWDEIFDQKLIRDNVRVQATRCMDCGVPLCQTSYGCPLGNIIPKWNDLVHKNDWREAILQLLQTNNFPEFTGRVCPAPCEGACVLGINESPVAIKTVELSIIEVAFERGWIKPEPPSFRTDKRVAIVGSGPAGLACAAQLNKAGHWVTVFERNDRPGGLLQYGIPSMKLSKQVVQRRLDLMREEGIQFECNADIGKTHKARDIYESFDAICLATGATWPRDLQIPGRDLQGIHYAMSFLERWQKHQVHSPRADERPAISATGKRVIVIGGGDTGCDCIGTSLRQGAKSIVAFEILPQPPATRAEDNPWPQWPKVLRTDYGYEEVKLVDQGQDPRRFCVSSKKFVDDGQGNVRGIETVEVEWIKDPSTGQFRCQDVAGSEKFYECDLVLIAMGFLGTENYIAKELNIELDQRSNIKSINSGAGNGNLYRTSVDRVYSAGDCRRGQSLVVHAINEGRQAARLIDADFSNGLSTLAGPGGIVTIG